MRTRVDINIWNWTVISNNLENTWTHTLKECLLGFEGNSQASTTRKTTLIRGAVSACNATTAKTFYEDTLFHAHVCDYFTSISYLQAWHLSYNLQQHD